MKNVIASIIICFAFYHQAQTQENMLPYHQIPAYPETYTAQNVFARMIDGLGYRFYWATDDLRPEDLEYAPPGKDTKNILETMRHIYSLSRSTLLGVKNEPIHRIELDSLGYEELRSGTLLNLMTASTILKAMENDLSEVNLIFSRGENTSEFPIWNLINGPTADALYHTGQIVSFRRSAGNPLSPLVNVFRGKNRELKND